MLTECSTASAVDEMASAGTPALSRASAISAALAPGVDATCAAAWTPHELTRDGFVNVLPAAAVTSDSISLAAPVAEDSAASMSALKLLMISAACSPVLPMRHSSSYHSSTDSATSLAGLPPPGALGLKLKCGIMSVRKFVRARITAVCMLL